MMNEHGCSGGCLGKIEFPENISEETRNMTNQHPCYNQGAHDMARMHIPIAPKCNISCNYCNRKYDCLNESRPGVTSEVLTPKQAVNKFAYVKEKVENLKVIGIAGPGDALANFEETKMAVKLIKEKDPSITICLSTNGLMLPMYGKEVVDMGIKHVTITINTIDPKIGAKIYKFVNYNGKIYSGEEAAKILLKNQLEGLEYLAANGVLCKVNIVMIKGINDNHIEKVVKKVKKLGAFMTNIMPLIPAGGSVFEKMPLVSNQELNTLRKKCSIDLLQMFHCRQCRADALGKLADERALEFIKLENNNDNIENQSSNPKLDAPQEEINPVKSSKQYIFAVASSTGKLIDRHFGKVRNFLIY